MSSDSGGSTAVNPSDPEGNLGRGSGDRRADGPSAQSAAGAESDAGSRRGNHVDDTRRIDGQNPAAGGVRPDEGPEDARRRSGRDAADRGAPEAAFDRDRASVVAREKERYGGLKLGCGFFGWLTATGTSVLLLALIAAIAALIGTNLGGISANDATENAPTVGIASGIILVVVFLIAYFCGGYVAGRMARFNGLKQGLGVWLWALVIAVVLAIVGAIVGSKFDVLGQLNAMPRIPIRGSDLTTGGIITAVALLLASLIGALLGGLAGMRFHRRVDRAGLERAS